MSMRSRLIERRRIVRSVRDENAKVDSAEGSKEDYVWTTGRECET